MGTPDGRNPLPIVQAVWIQDEGQEAVRFVPADPGKALRMFDEHTQVVLKRALPSLRLEPGDVGIVVYAYGKGAAYEVEFLSLDGNTIGVSTMEAADLRRPSGRAVLHERQLMAA
jgi:Domain of unknown function (DUF4926)